MSGDRRAGHDAPWGLAAAGALAVLALLLGWLWRDAFPPLPSPLTLEVVFADGAAGRGEPLITTGAAEEADFLAVRHLGGGRAVIFYDVWGMGGPTSAPFELQPGKKHRLEITMPTLAHVASYRSHERRPLRVTLDGAVLLDEPVYFHRRAPADVHFAHNPLGGTLVEPDFSGTLAAAGGPTLRGGPEAYFATGARLRWLLAAHPWWLLACLALSSAGGALILLAWRLRVPARLFAPDAPGLFPARVTSPPHGWFAGAAAACLLVFAAVLTGGTFRVIAPDAFGEQYDWQARSLLHGRLDLPAEAKTAESFVFEGRNYIYFGPTPALLRLPFALVDAGFGRLTRLFLLLYFAGWLAGAYAMLLHVARLARGPDAWPSAGAAVFFTAVAGLGSTMLFLASRAYVYHEAIACGAVFALWSVHGALRWLAAPQGRAWLGALACGILAVQARPPAGLFALGVLGAAALLLTLRPGGPWARCRLAGVALLAALGILSFNAVSYLKFRSFEGAPLRYHVQYDAKRLAGIRGKNFHVENFRHGFDAYMWRPDFSLRPSFPFIALERSLDADYKDARIDLAEPTLALPFAMPSLWLLAIGGVAAAGRWPAARAPTLALAAGFLPMALALFTAVAISHRYTGDFCPPMVALGAFGLVALDRLPGPARRGAWIALVILGALGVLVTLAITLRFQGEVVWGVPEEFKARYQMLRQAVDSALGFARP